MITRWIKERREENRSGKNNSVLKKECTNSDSKFTKAEISRSKRILVS